MNVSAFRANGRSALMALSGILMLGLVLAALTWRPVLGQSQDLPAPVAGAETPLDPAVLYHSRLDSVVRIEIARSLTGPDGEETLETLSSDILFLERMLGNAAGSGSGFFIDDQGTLVTNHSLVQGAEQIHVILSDGSWHVAELLGEDTRSNLAVLRIDDLAQTITPISLADGASAAVGDQVYAIGLDGALQGIMTQGMVSRVENGVRSSRELGHIIPNMIQSDMRPTSDMAGGPLLNARGQLVGMIMDTGFGGLPGQNSLPAAIPSTLIARVTADLIAEGEFISPYLGISGHDPSLRDALVLNSPTLHLGAMVDGVQSGSAAEIGGIQPGDILVDLNDQAIGSFAELAGHLILNFEPGDRVAFTVLREGERIPLQVTLGTLATGRP